ncbi:Putative acyl-CoA dehydrogenase FadE17 [BD1-7 clade bacterium]|uniref:Acyl-CoA dehydrogenase FadE17 n=1 Tax=BD1-7 clade bacterium TaxID=2029982 RepID=A0A5S9QPQ2_9GAMM|nr:Putative acyl-CoA dehydrogenase FadE17 [BD1-7 clade bacterium]CAA0120660.1 Putative acyl-CoA dehydrogenase FadE17 [BD1-7 clade bacterium]
MDALEQFRAETREWLEANCPESMRTPVPDMDSQSWGGRNAHFKSDEQKQWFDAMRDKFTFCPDWPVEYGGGGLSAQENTVLKEELKRISARPANINLGIWMAGPAIMEFGSEEQKRQHLPPIARGEMRWCQGYSEPGAGSDLAGLQTKAVREGDEFVINGSKIWTSYADESDYIYCLVRTNTDAPKREGITFLVFDMETEGVSTQPIELTNGDAHFCQTFFDNVRVPVANVIGEIDKGWTVAKRVLELERAMMSDIEESASRHEDSPAAIAKEYLGVTADGKIADPVLRDRIAQNAINSDAMEITMKRVFEEFAAQDPLAGMAMMIAKYQGTEEDKRKYQLILDIMGNRGLGWDGDAFTEDELRINKQHMLTYAHTIAGGTSEVQLNIIAKRILGLPD